MLNLRTMWSAARVVDDLHECVAWSGESALRLSRIAALVPGLTLCTARLPARVPYALFPSGPLLVLVLSSALGRRAARVATAEGLGRVLLCWGHVDEYADQALAVAEPEDQHLAAVAFRTLLLAPDWAVLRAIPAAADGSPDDVEFAARRISRALDIPIWMAEERATFCAAWARSASQAIG